MEKEKLCRDHFKEILIMFSHHMAILTCIQYHSKICKIRIKSNWVNNQAIPSLTPGCTHSNINKI
jgi:hypothetical protein